jgi:hypothetical protein
MTADQLLREFAALPHDARVRRMVELGGRSLERRLAASDDERLRRLALAALVAQAQPPHGWDEVRLTRLRAYRTDRSALVAAAAQFTLPPAEEG